MEPRKEGIEIVVWLVLLVRVGVLVAIIWYGISEFRRWKKSQQPH
jgi:hypothetical protein